MKKLCHLHHRIEQKEDERLINYDPFKFNLSRIWKLKKVTISALDSVTDRIETWIKKTGINWPVELLQKESLLGKNNP